MPGRIFRPFNLAFVARAAGAVAAALGAIASSSFADDAGTLPSTTVVPPALDDVEHMCALLTGCGKLPLPSTPKDFASCVRSMEADLASGAGTTFSLTLRECGLKASSCVALRTCALRGAKADVCAGRGKFGPVDLCDSSGRAVSCLDERVTLVRDCPRGGEQCVVQEGRSFCALGKCTDESPPACSRSGTRILECKKGKLHSLDCGAFGLRCTTESGTPHCTTAGTLCRDGVTRCEGALAMTCLHGHEAKIDCAAGKLSCGSGTPVGACSTGAAATCDPNEAPTCDGASVTWCAWGSPRSYPCKSMGFATCVSDELGAHCAN